MMFSCGLTGVWDNDRGGRRCTGGWGRCGCSRPASCPRRDGMANAAARLTVLYGALFLAAGALLPLSFLLFRQGLDNALRAPLRRGHSQPFPQLVSPSPPSTRPHARAAPGTTGAVV